MFSSSEETAADVASTSSEVHSGSSEPSSAAHRKQATAHAEIRWLLAGPAFDDDNI